MNLFRKFLSLAFRQMSRSAHLRAAVREIFQLWYGAPDGCSPRHQRRDLDKVVRHCYGLSFPLTHFYSPLPDVPALKRNLHRWYKPSESPGMDWNVEGQFEFARAIALFSSELQELAPFSGVTKDGYGPGYGEVEAHLLFMILRELKCAKVIEVGSGVSTYYALRALRMNRELDGVHSEMMCIEPYPNGKLRELVTEQNVRLRQSEVQDVPLSEFADLRASDVLFIDSSHVSKKDSDVDFLYLEVLPRLQRGVVIHIHDIPLPMPAIPKEHPLFDDFLFWNETALVKAFLLFNDSFRVLMSQGFLHRTHPEVLKMAAPAYDPELHFPCSLWLQKVK